MRSNYFVFRLHQARRALGRWFRTARLWFHNYIQRHIYGAWRKLGQMRWQFAAWILVAFISIFGLYKTWNHLDVAWQKTIPTSGGTYREGIVGRVHLVNPLYEDNTATSDVTALVFSRLIRVKANEVVESDLATSWEASSDKRTYTIGLRPGVKWQDGVPLTAKDVVFTFKTIQNPDSRSLLAASWDKVVINQVDDAHVQFVLPASYSGFLNALGRVSILPEHVLGGVQANMLRLDEYNQQPIGSGPFMMEPLDPRATVIRLKRNPEYYGQSAYLDAIELRQFDDARGMLDSYAKREIDGMAGVLPEQVNSLEHYPQLDLSHSRLPVMVGMYFNTKRTGLGNVEVRRALTKAVDREAIFRDVLHDQGSIINYPILPGYGGFNAQATKPSYNGEAAKSALEGVFKDRLKLVTVNSGNYPVLAARIAKNFQDAGVAVDVVTVDSFSLQQNYIRPREYDILLYGQDMGGESDVYSFWHSSQSTDPGLNLSAYSNPKADQLIEQARLGKDPAFRNKKYAEFVSLWAEDAPALLLYSPDYLYAHTVRLTGVDVGYLTSPSDRFYHAERWALKTKQVAKKGN